MPKGLRTLDFSFTETHLTHFGGMVLMQRFCKQVRLRWLLQSYVRMARRNADYAAADLLLALVYAIIAGLRRINKTELLQYNGTFIDLVGLSRFPDQSTLRRFLQQLPTRAVRQLVRLHDRLRAQLLRVPQPPTSLIFDLDSVVLTLYGHQQGARVGYNPKKKGRRSYHPLLCFESYRQEFWHGSLRPGDTSANTGVVSFFRRCLAKVPSEVARSRIRVRADSGFFGGKFIGSLEKQGLSYVIVAKEYRPIRERARGARFHRLRSGFEAGEFRYQAHGWPNARRFVVIRRPIPDDPVEAKQLTLFKDRRSPARGATCCSCPETIFIGRSLWKRSSEQASCTCRKKSEFAGNLSGTIPVFPMLFAHEAPFSRIFEVSTTWRMNWKWPPTWPRAGRQADQD